MKVVRGYIFSRPFVGERVPQHVQNLVIRNYCEKHNLHYLLSATEYAMTSSHHVLDWILEELPQIDGIIAYSLFQLPEGDDVRARVYESVLSQGKMLHFAVEGLKVLGFEDVGRVESIWQVKKACNHEFSVSDALRRFFS